MSMGGDPMQQLAQMRAQPIGPNQGVGQMTPGAPPPAGPTPLPQQGPTAPEQAPPANPLADLSAQIHGGQKAEKLKLMLAELQKLYPKLLLAEHDGKGHAEMKGSAQDQFLGAAWARMKGAKTAHVRNQGKGQRLHLEW